jgi:hypothetical protein
MRAFSSLRRVLPIGLGYGIAAALGRRKHINAKGFGLVPDIANAAICQITG